jgi:hypothetical protein
MKPSVWISSIRFSDQSSINLERDDVVIVVGPNNAGKSETLRALAEKLRDSDRKSPVVVEISIRKEGTYAELIDWLKRTAKLIDTGIGPQFESFGGRASVSFVRSCWEENRRDISQLSGFFSVLLDAEERLKAANPPNSIAVTREAPNHPIHVLQWDDSVELRISQHFERAFGVGLVVHRNAGKSVPILVGKAPEIRPGKDRVSIEHVLELEKLPAVHTQGDGMRSFLGVLLFTAVGSESIQLIDEPEAFLHPPQARHLGNFLATETAPDRQLFVATHSGDVLRGVLDSGNPRVRVLRIRRKEDRNVVCHLDNSQVAQVWSDPLLRYSNILDGLFHERVVVCESDSDCRFYSAVTDALFESGARTERRPDVMFTHCGGKDRLRLIVRSLKSLQVPTSVVTDFDVLREEYPLRSIVGEAGGQWQDLKSDWKEVKRAIDDKKPELSLAEAKRDIDAAFAAATGHILPETARKMIQDALRASSPWSTAKSVGMPFVPSGQQRQAADRLVKALEKLGIFVVPVGELEGFLKAEGGHGPAWVAGALKRDLKADPELEAARQFVRKIIQ